MWILVVIFSVLVFSFTRSALQLTEGGGGARNTLQPTFDVEAIKQVDGHVQQCIAQEKQQY